MEPTLTAIVWADSVTTARNAVRSKLCFSTNLLGERPVSEIKSTETVKADCQHLSLTCEMKSGTTPTVKTAVAIFHGFRCVDCGVTFNTVDPKGRSTPDVSIPLILTTPAQKPEVKAASNKKPVKSSADPKKGLPGTEMLLLTSELGIEAPPGCGCKGMAVTMDKLGVDGCRERINELKLGIAANWDSWGWKDKLGAFKASAWKAVGLGISPTDPVRDLVEIAIERADKKRETA